MGVNKFAYFHLHILQYQRQNFLKLRDMAQKMQCKPPTGQVYLSGQRNPIQLSPRGKLKEQPNLFQESSSPTVVKGRNPAESTNLYQFLTKNASQNPLDNALIKKMKNPQSPSSHTKASSPFSYTNKVTLNGSTEAVKAVKNNFCYVPIKSAKIEESKNTCEMNTNEVIDKAIAQQFENELNQTNLLKQKNYWKQNYLKIKQQYEAYMRKNPCRDKLASPKRGQEDPVSKPTQNTNLRKAVSSNQNVKLNMQDLIKAIKNAQVQVTELSKQKASLQAQIAFLKDQNRKVNYNLFELKKEATERERKQRIANAKIVLEQKKVIGRLVETKSTFSPSALISNDDEDTGNKQNDRVMFAAPHQTGLLRSKTLSHSQLTKAGSVKGPNQPSQEQAVCPLKVYIEQKKELDKTQLLCKKTQKALELQNEQIMVSGLRKLSQKYTGEQQSPKSLTTNASTQLKTTPRRNFFEPPTSPKLTLREQLRQSTGTKPIKL